MKKGLFTLLLFVGLTGAAWAKPSLIKIDGSSTVFPITELVGKRFEKRVTGSVFGSKGAQVGVKTEDLLKKE